MNGLDIEKAAHKWIKAPEYKRMPLITFCLD